VRRRAGVAPVVNRPIELVDETVVETERPRLVCSTPVDVMRPFGRRYVHASASRLASGPSNLGVERASIGPEERGLTRQHETRGKPHLDRER
jgi:hypothetical protein